MWYALWVRIPGQAAPFFASWIYMTADQYQQVHRWLRHDPYPCVFNDAQNGFADLTLYDLVGNAAFSVPRCGA
jgi:hypothetical protein